MYSQTYLCNRKDQKTYYGRIRVPLDIQHVYGKKEVKRALRTTDLREAKRRVQVWALKLLQEFDEVRRKLGGAPKRGTFYTVPSGCGGRRTQTLCLILQYWMRRYRGSLDESGYMNIGDVLAKLVSSRR
jgi:hypothetical protein